FFFFQAEDGIRDFHVTGVQTCALPISALRAAPATRQLNEPGTPCSGYERKRRCGSFAPAHADPSASFACHPAASQVVPCAMSGSLAVKLLSFTLARTPGHELTVDGEDCRKMKALQGLI